MLSLRANFAKICVASYLQNKVFESGLLGFVFARFVNDELKMRFAFCESRLTTNLKAKIHAFLIKQIKFKQIN